MTLGAPRPSPLVEQAAANLREQISCGHWPVGTRLPGETTLAKTLGVGRSTVREALRALAGAGLVQPRQGAGVFVIATRPEEDWPTRLRRAAVADVFEVRMLLEVQAARLAAVRRTDGDLTALRTALEARRAAADGDGPAFADADLALHAAVVAAAHNPVLVDLFAQLAPALRQAATPPPDLAADAGPTALIDAIAAADPDAAAQALTAELTETLADRRP
ncbi:FCD domain-containing protein [Streptomyces albidochromogenes]|uniref:FadR/GntR family transcriptional regulator n=1 Tax=Streptomyces albidochromogenes TaxID=329524 RepID=UPI00110F969E|nr:FCD domain-containing protein [Streptomyces albidochromogenes]